MATVRIKDHTTCCQHDHVRECGQIYGAGDDLCACGCSAYDERCGGSEWWTLGTLPIYSVFVIFLNGGKVRVAQGKTGWTDLQWHWNGTVI